MSSAAPIKGRVRRADYRRLSHGLYLPEDPNAGPHQRALDDLRAWMLVLPPGTAFTHVTAAGLLRWWTPQLPASTPIFAATTQANRPRRSGLICSRLPGDEGYRIVRGGFRVAEPAEVLLRAARDLAELDLIPLVESALRTGDLDADALAEVCATRRPGVRPLRNAWSHADVRSESPMETMLRLFHQHVGITVTPQVDLHDGAGRFLGRADLLIDNTPYVQEYDGSYHREAGQQSADLRRDRRFLASTYQRRGYTAADLLSSPLATLAEIDALLGRPHDPRRVSNWRQWVARSCYSETGRARIAHRWRKEAAIHWARTA